MKGISDKGRKNINSTNAISRINAIKMMEVSYLSSTASLIWVALYYLPIGGAFFRLALPLPLVLLQLRRGTGAAIEGLALSVILLLVLMGPVRGPLVLFPYGMLALWLGWCWVRGFSWWLSWSIGGCIGTFGFFIRVFVLSLLVGENLWIVITRAAYSLIERVIQLFDLQFIPDLLHVQIVAICLVVIQELIYVLTLHAIAFWIFPKLKASMPDPPTFLNPLVSIEQL